MEKKLEYLLWRKDDDLGWYISKASFNIKDFNVDDVCYFMDIFMQGKQLARVGASMYELNWRTVE